MHTNIIHTHIYCIDMHPHILYIHKHSYIYIHTHMPYTSYMHTLSHTQHIYMLLSHPTSQNLPKHQFELLISWAEITFITPLCVYVNTSFLLLFCWEIIYSKMCCLTKYSFPYSQLKLTAFIPFPRALVLRKYEIPEPKFNLIHQFCIYFILMNNLCFLD